MHRFHVVVYGLLPKHNTYTTRDDGAWKLFAEIILLPRMMLIPAAHPRCQNVTYCFVGACLLDSVGCMAFHGDLFWYFWSGY